MTKSYHARLHGDRIEWIDAPPASSPDDTPLEIDIVMRSKNRRVESDVEHSEAGRKMYEILCGLASLPETGFPDDAVAWQREMRKERPLPDRESGE